MNAARRPAATRSAARALRAWVQPEVFDFWSTRLHPLWTWQRPRARLLQRERASSDAVTLILKANRHWRGLRAGQHVQLGVEIDGRRLTRSYSPTPLPGGRLAITVKAIDGGRVPGTPSTVVDLTGAEPLVVRRGPASPDEVLRRLGAAVRSG
jgi:hypothetical protein